jgi:hypothetical protein
VPDLGVYPGEVEDGGAAGKEKTSPAGVKLDLVG